MSLLSLGANQETLSSYVCARPKPVLPERVRSMEGLGGTLPSLNFTSKAFKVLLVCQGHKLSYFLVVLDGVKGLKPHHFGALAFGLQLDG